MKDKDEKKDTKTFILVQFYQKYSAWEKIF